MPLKDIFNQAKVNAKVCFPRAAEQVLGKLTAQKLKTCSWQSYLQVEGRRAALSSPQLCAHILHSRTSVAHILIVAALL